MITEELPILPGIPLVSFLDALGRRVTLVPTRAGTAAILTRTVDEGEPSGQPCLDPGSARELGLALVAWADRGAS